MSKALAPYDYNSVVGDDEPPPNDSARGAIRIGIGVLLIFFGGFGAWAVTAPLNGAVMGNAIIKVEGNRKSVQHLQGGIVKELRVKEGDAIKAGDILIVLDDADMRSQYDVLAQQDAMLRATEARLGAELNDSPSVQFPPDLLAQRSQTYVETAIGGQLKEFASRRAAIDGQRNILNQRIAQLREEMTGLDAQLTALRAQLQSVRDEKESLGALSKKDLVPRSRILELERSANSFQGQIGSAQAESDKARQQIAELTEQIAQLDKDRSAQIAQDLRETRFKILDVGPRLQNAATSLQRLEIRAPYSGRVVGLAVFSVGAVIRPGDRILDIVPNETRLTVEAQISVEDISDVRPGMAAEVHFTSYKQRLIPLIHGTVAEVSADRLTNEKTGVPYYVVQVDVNQKELTASPEIKLYPGMPATVMVTTNERTALDYLLGPLVASFDRSFRQR